MRVDEYQMRPKGYDYQLNRRRQIFEALTQGVQYVFNTCVHGDIAEFGTASGFSSLCIARAMNLYSQMYSRHAKREKIPADKTFHLFDSFQGLPKIADPADLETPNVVSGRWQEGSFRSLTQPELEALVTTALPKEKTVFLEGWYSETLKRISKEQKFAFLHIDVDIYSSTIEVLDYVFANDHVSDGCVVLFDDWNCNRASPKFGQRRAWREATEKYGVEFSDCGEYAVLGRKFIVHR